MVTATIIGCGGCGNKAAIALLENKVIDMDHVRLLNTTSRDVPDEYKSNSDLFMLFSKDNRGTGKQCDTGRSSMINALRDGLIDISRLINDDAQEVILVSSVEGGSGSGAVPVLAKYFASTKIPVHVFAFIGFQEDARSINNTIKFFKSLPPEVILHTIKNSHFLDYTKNYNKAEIAANNEFVYEVDTMLGHKIIPSKHNIDDADLFKINTLPGYMTINHIPLSGLKNTESVNNAIIASFENACYMDNDTSAKRIGVIINASHKVQEAIDNSYEVVKRYVGIPIETYQHIQPDDDSELINEEYMDVLVCGMNYPEKALRDVNNKYNKLKDKFNVQRKSFDDIFGDVDNANDEISQFDINIKRENPAKIEDLFSADLGGMYGIVQPKSNELTQSSYSNPLQNPMMNRPSNTTRNIESIEVVSNDDNDLDDF